MSGEESAIMTTAETPSTLEANKALVRRAIAYNHGAADDGSEIFASDFVAYMPGQPPMNLAGLEQFISRVAGGMPGFRYEIHEQIAQGDTVFNRITSRGVHTADLAGVPATGRPIELRIINLFKVRGGRVVEQWAQLDMLGLLRQIGAIPSA
jgi:predicted ester cyclase